MKLAALTAVFLFAPLAVADSKPPAAKPAPKVIAKPAKKISKVPVEVAPDPEGDPDGYVDPVDTHRKALPAAPTDLRTYETWKRRLSPVQRQAVERFCRVDRPADFEPHCGGIGIHRIPSPPRLTRVGVSQADLVAWKNSLTRIQRATYEHLCANEDNAYSELCGGTPLVVSFDGGAVAMSPASAGQPTDWPTAATPWLALDRDGDGAITDGAELFGDATVLPDGRTARHGFEALAALDANGDGRIDRADPLFASLVLWADRDGDRTSAPGELVSAARVIESIELGYAIAPRCDARLNCERERSVMRYRDAAGALHEGAIVDVYLHFR